MRPKGSAKDLEVRRRRAIELLDSGLTPTQVAFAIGVARQTVPRLKASFRDGSKNALKAIPQHVDTCQLSVAHLVVPQILVVCQH